MKRFLGVLIASMFLASAAYAADDMKDMKEKKADGETKGDAKAKDGKAKDGKAKAKDGDAKAKSKDGDKADKPADTK
jgi:hypothetical protein